MYVVAFFIFYFLTLYREKTESFQYPRGTIQNYLIWALWGLMIGARLGYVAFYNFTYYVTHPLEIILPFSFEMGFHYTGIGGMSYHGGLIGILIASVLFCKKSRIEFWRFTDFIVPAIPLGYTFGRVGNFINGELFGRVTTMPWGMYFPLDRTHQLRHPSQLYEAFFEGVVLFAILWSVRKKYFFTGFLLSLYMIGYGLVRFFIEFVREPDSHLGSVFGPFSMGQVLCLLMISGGMLLFFLRKGKK
jgi:phosphatidylglycerol:prolipoprotein diacylglycerol transferase